jgi:probable phosphoglycerate mutase
MKIFLARHGNTFNIGDTPVYLGCGQDLPLTEQGRAQADALGSALRRLGIVPAAILSGPLSRAREFSERVRDAVAPQLAVRFESRLNELDYGVWAGLAKDEVIARFGEAPLARWEHDGEFPESAGWAPDRRTVITEVQKLASEIVSGGQPDDSFVLVSSNGRLRFFLTLIPGAFEEHARSRALSVATGKVSCITFTSGRFSLDFWNRAPADL